MVLRFAISLGCLCFRRMNMVCVLPQRPQTYLYTHMAAAFDQYWCNIEAEPNKCYSEGMKTNHIEPVSRIRPRRASRAHRTPHIRMHRQHFVKTKKKKNLKAEHF